MAMLAPALEVGCVVTDHQSAVVLLCNSDALIDRFYDLSTDHSSWYGTPGSGFHHRYRAALRLHS